MSTFRSAAQEIVKELSVSEKAKLLSQIVWETTDIEKIHPSLRGFLLADGPAGIRRLKEYFDEDIYNTKPSTCYPSPSTFASSWDRDLIFALGEHMGLEARQEGVDTMLAPAVNIRRSPLGGRNFEYYSEDPYLTGELATEFIKGIQKEGVGACLKHFAANNQETRRMNINAEIDEETLHEIYLAAFEKPVKEGKPRMIMAAYNQINGEHCASNEKLLDFLRKEWNYEGVVVTDCYAAHDLAKGIRHGLTLQMPGEKEERIIAQIRELLDKGEITEEELDQAVVRNVEFALEAADNRIGQCSYDREAHHCFAGKIAEESMVLLKNDQHLLPLEKTAKILVTGELAVRPRFQGGGSSHVNPWKLEIPLEEIRKQSARADYLQGYKTSAGEKENQRLLSEVLAAAENYDAVVVFAGLPDLTESEGYDRITLELPKEQNRLIGELVKKNGNVCVVLSNGSVVEMPWRNQIPAILEAYLGGEAGASAAARILFGEVNPSGKLTETFPLAQKDHPSYLYFPGDRKRVVYGEGKFVGYRHYTALDKPAAFPFGHGLSYTEFVYESGGALFDREKNCVRMTLENTGSRKGKEIVQVYVQRKTEGESPMPRKLAGFTKIELEPGECRKVQIPLSEKNFYCYKKEIHGWKLQAGEYEIMIGSSVSDIRLRESVFISGETEKAERDHTLGDLIRIEGMYEKLEKAFTGHEVSLGFLKMTQDEDPLKAVSMGSLMTFETLKRTDPTLTDSEIEKILLDMNGK